MSLQQEYNAVAVQYQQLAADHYAYAEYWRRLSATGAYHESLCTEHAVYHQKQGALFASLARDSMGVAV